MKNIIIILLVLYGIHFFSEQRKQIELARQGTEPAESIPRANSFLESNTKSNDSKSISNTSGFSCDGRVYCSEMHSCEEAEFFINNCPGTKMDGDHDGVPCEQQWCKRF